MDPFLISCQVCLSAFGGVFMSECYLFAVRIRRDVVCGLIQKLANLRTSCRVIPLPLC